MAVLSAATDVRALLERGLADSAAQATEFVYTESREDLTRFGANAITQNVMKSSRSLSIRVQDGGREARVEISQVTPEGIAKGIAEAMEAARLQDPDPTLMPMLAEKQVYRPVEWPAERDVGPEGRADAVLRSIEVCRKEGARAGGTCSSTETRTIVANSNGIFADGIKRDAEFSITAEKEGGSGWADAVAVNHD